MYYVSEFETLALGVLDVCYNEDEVLAEMLVEREIPKWGGMSPLSLAAAVNGRLLTPQLSAVCILSLLDI